MVLTKAFRYDIIVLYNTKDLRRTQRRKKKHLIQKDRKKTKVLDKMALI